VKLRERFARIIDPGAFAFDRDEKLNALMDHRRTVALGKAEEILACEASLEDLEVADVAGVESAIDTMRATLELEGAGRKVPAMIGDDGRPVYNALVKPMPDSLLVMVLIAETGDVENDDNSPWAVQSLASEEAVTFAAEIEVYAAGGGSA
jgi:hypothetical protein